MPPLIEFNGVSLGYGRSPVLSGVDLDIQQGDFLGIVGPNGAGKTTLLRAILGLIRPASGAITRPVADLRIGYVPQRDSLDTLFPLTVSDVVMMGRYAGMPWYGRPGAADRAAVQEALGHVSISDLAQRHFNSLSGGQKQRTLIARALVSQPELLVLDEPTNGMDLPSEHAILELIRDLHRVDGLTVLMVSHLLSSVVNYAGRIAVVANGTVREGTVEGLVNSRVMGELYGMPVFVGLSGGRLVVLPGEAREVEPCRN